MATIRTVGELAISAQLLRSLLGFDDTYSIKAVGMKAHPVDDDEGYITLALEGNADRMPKVTPMRGNGVRGLTRVHECDGERWIRTELENR